jgi:hypothetical protein
MPVFKDQYPLLMLSQNLEKTSKKLLRCIFRVVFALFCQKLKSFLDLRGLISGKRSAPGFTPPQAACSNRFASPPWLALSKILCFGLLFPRIYNFF